MNKFKKPILTLLAAFLLLVITPAQVRAQSPDGDGKIVFGGSYRLSAGENLNGDLVILGGSAAVEKDAKVNGAVVLAGGSIQIDGEVDGDIVAIGGAVDLGDTAVVRGDINTIGASLRRSENAVVEGGVHIETPGELNLDLPSLPRSGNSTAVTAINKGLEFVSGILAVFLQSLATAALAMLAALFLEKPLERVKKSTLAQPIMAVGLGLLTLVVAPGLLILMAVTIILLPVSLLGILLLAVSILIGWIAVGLEVGGRIARALRVDWSSAVEAGVGTLLISLLGAAFMQIPCVGWTLPVFVAVFGLGGVLMSGFGTRLATTASQSSSPGGKPESAPLPAAPSEVPSAAVEAEPRTDVPEENDPGEKI